MFTAVFTDFEMEGLKMARWSGIRKKLESEYLAESLKGHIQYFAKTEFGKQ